MRFLKKPATWIVLALVIVIALATARTLNQKRERAELPLAQVQTPPTELLAEDLTIASLQPLRRSLQINGSLRAVNQATVKAKAAGELRDFLVREGEAVRAGQVLARIDPTEMALRERQAAENVASARGQFEIAKKNRDTSKSLAERGFISDTSYQNSESQLATAKANVDAASAALDLTRKALADTEVRAPIAGLVATRLVQPGEKVAIDTRLLEIVDPNTLELEAVVPAADIAKVRIGQSLAIRPEGTSTALSGKVVRINPASQAGTRSVLVYASVANSGANLRAGMFAQAELTLELRPAVLVVPATALRSNNGRNTVYAIENNQITEREVTIRASGDDAGGLVEIVSGLAVGAQVVRVNLGTLAPGRAVRIVGAPANDTKPAP